VVTRAVNRRFQTTLVRVRARVSHVQFVVNKVALGQVIGKAKDLSASLRMNAAFLYNSTLYVTLRGMPTGLLFVLASARTQRPRAASLDEVP
jgi:hypothetical protein